jgi:hypothetical protein
MTGTKQLADFQAFVNSPNVLEEDKAKRRQWIEDLQNGKNPFTDKVLEELKNEWLDPPKHKSQDLP